MTLRTCKILLMAVMAAFFTAVVFNNVTDYPTNLVFVKHVMSMDTTFQNENTAWRAINSPLLQSLFFIGIVCWEGLAALFCWIATIQLFKTRYSVSAFSEQKRWAYTALTIAFSLYAFGFMTMANEWFMMWQSAQWNGTGSAANFISMIGFVFLIMLSADE